MNLIISVFDEHLKIQCLLLKKLLVYVRSIFYKYIRKELGYKIVSDEIRVGKQEAGVTVEVVLRMDILTPDNSYRNGMIAGMPYNIDPIDFTGIFEEEK